MIKKIVDWFNTPDTDNQKPMPINLAAAAMLVEVMAADDEWQKQEESVIQTLLEESLKLSAQEANDLIAAAKQHHDSAHDLFEIAKSVNQHYSAEQKFELIKDMWIVAYADGNVDRYEDHIIRRIAELLYIPHNQFIQAKLEAKPE